MSISQQVLILKLLEQQQEQLKRMYAEVHASTTRMTPEMKAVCAALIRNELLRSHLVTPEVTQPEQVLQRMTCALGDWITRSPARDRLLCHHLLPIIGERMVWMENDRICVHFNFLHKFVRAVFACMSDYHLSRFRSHPREEAIALRIFLEHVVEYRRGSRPQPLHIMMPILRCVQSMD